MTVSSGRVALRIAVFVVLVVVVGVLYLTPARELLTFENARRVVESFRDLWYGPLLFILLFAAGCVLAAPATIFILSAGVIWGWWPGALYALGGGILGAMISLFVGRFLGKGLLPKLGKAGMKLEQQLEKADFGSILLVRLIPLFPFPVINYASGIAGVKATEFFFATLIALAPGAFILSYSADAIVNGTLSAGDALKRIMVAAVLLMLLVLMPRLIKRLMARDRQPGI